MKICKVQSAQSAKPSATPTRPGQPMNPPYLSEMPSVDRVKSEIQGANPDDTLARQVAVFTYLPQIVQRSQDPNRRYGDPLTPDEQRVVGAYNLAAYETSQAYAKSHSPEEAKAFERKHGQYEMDAAFYQEWFNRLFSPAFRAGYQQVQNANNAQAKAHFDAERRQYEDAKAQQAAPDSPANTGEVQPGSKAELRRCIASGRSQRNCFSEVMGNGFDQMTGISLKTPSTPGLRMTGDYSSPTGFRVIFQPDKAAMSCRGVPSPQPYTVELSDTQALVKIHNGSKPVIFVLRQDGKLEASGPVKITGQVPAGSTTEQTMGMTAQKTTTQRELTPLEAQNYPDAKQNGQVLTNSETSTQMAYGPTGTRTVTQYVNKTVDCNLGLMTPTGPTPLPPDIESPFGLITTIFSGASVLMEGGNTQKALGQMLNLDKAPSPGLRMTGRYAGQQGFSETFHPESATVDGVRLYNHWQGMPPGAGTPKHPTREILHSPQIFEFATPVQGTYPPWYDPSYWYSGIRPTFRLGAQLAAIRYGVDKYFELFSRVGCLFGGLLVFVLLQPSPANFFKQFRKSFLLWMPAIAGLAMYSLLHVEDRFLGGFLLLLWAASFMSVRIRPTQHSVARAITWSIVLVLGIQTAWPAGHAVVRLATLQPSPDLAVAKQLRDEEINPGDKVAFVNSALLDHYWAHLAGVSVAAEVYDASQFWSAPPVLKSKAISKLTQSGAQAIVARDLPAEFRAAGWQRVPNTNYYLLIPSK